MPEREDPKRGSIERASVALSFEQFRYKTELGGTEARFLDIQPFNNFYLQFFEPGPDLLVPVQPWTERFKAEHAELFERVSALVMDMYKRGQSEMLQSEELNRALYEAYLVARSYVADDWELFS